MRVSQLERARAYAAQFDRVVWLLVVGEVFEAAGRYMVQPFLALYLSNKHIDLGVIGLVLAAGPIANLLLGLLGGSLADRVGRKPLVVWSTVLSALTLAGFGLASGVLAFALLNFLNTAARAMYRPANFAALADVTPPEQRMEAFGLRRVGLNIGAAIGPVLGFWCFQVLPLLGFLLAGVLSLALGAAALVWLPETKSHTGDERAPNEREAWGTVLRDGALWMFVLAGAGFMGAARIVDSFLVLAIVGNAPAWLIPTLFSLNAVLVSVLQLPINRALKGRSLGTILMAGGVLYALSWFGLAASLHTVNVLILTVVMTFGELIAAAALGVFVSLIAPPKLRGRYEAAANVRETGRAIVPALGGFVMVGYGASTLFLLMGIMLLLSGAIGVWANALAGERTRPLHTA